MYLDTGLKREHSAERATIFMGRDVLDIAPVCVSIIDPKSILKNISRCYPVLFPNVPTDASTKAVGQCSAIEAVGNVSRRVKVT
jgi:tRNA splicing ligase